MQTQRLVIAIAGFYAIDKLLISHMSFDNTVDKLGYNGRVHQLFTDFKSSYELLMRGFYTLFSFSFLALLKLIN